LDIHGDSELICEKFRRQWNHMESVSYLQLSVPRLIPLRPSLTVKFCEFIHVDTTGIKCNLLIKKSERIDGQFLHTRDLA
jgi:hypothetical protein